jgi:glycosyltransferase involved in cell wall biosynthesis
MKLCIICNYGPPHCGGSEEVIKNISKCLINQYDYDITIFARNYHKSSFWNGINLLPCPKGNALISQLNNFDHTFVYSDSQWNWEDIVKNINKIDSKVSVALVGAYHMRSNLDVLNLVKKDIDKFNLITHSSATPDYEWCIDNKLVAEVVPNGVNLTEFQNDTIDFREKYNIKEKYILLFAANFFYGKGFEVLPEICRNIAREDIAFLSLSNTIKYPYDKTFLQKTKQQSIGLNIRFLRDLPREDVIAAFNASDIFVSTSKKEVAPLVILESQAAGTPWISMDVGNTGERAGGIIIKNPDIDSKGYKVVNDKIVDKFAENIKSILLSNELRKQLISEGLKDIYQLDWNDIVPEYNRIFNS